MQSGKMHISLVREKKSDRPKKPKKDKKVEKQFDRQPNFRIDNFLKILNRYFLTRNGLLSGIARDIQNSGFCAPLQG